MNEQALKNRLKAIAREQNTTFNEAWKRLLLERFLYRISQSPYSGNFIFKGGFLLSYLITLGRETMDLDFLLERIKAEITQVTVTIKNLAFINCHDGFVFTLDKVEYLSQPHMAYPGYRAFINARFGNMRDKIHIDIGIGDVVEPEIREISLFRYKGKPFFEEEMSLHIYPIETIFAEKLETIISKGSANSRMKDFHDLFLLLENSLLDKNKLHKAIEMTFANRNTVQKTIQFSPKNLSTMRNFWNAHYKQLGNIAKTLKLPRQLEEIIVKINAFLAST